MNFTILGRNSTAGPIYTDRLSLQCTQTSESRKKSTYQPHHLNPSKSKVNVRNSLNKTNQNMAYSNHNIDNIRASCFVANPISTYQHIKKQSPLEDKYNKIHKEANQISFQLISKDSFYKCNSATPPSVLGEESRKKDYIIPRGSLKEPFIPGVQQDLHKNKQSKMLDEIKSQLLALNKRVFINEQEICKLKQKQKEKKLQTLEQQFTQFQIQMFDILKKNSNFFADFEFKIQKNSSLINEIQQKVLGNNQEDDLHKKLSICERKINELSELVKAKDESSSKAIVSLFSIQQTQIKGLINDHIHQFKLRLDKNAVETNQILIKLSKLNQKVKEKSNKVTEYFKDSRKSYSSIIVENKQVLIVRQTGTMRDSTKQHLNQQSIPKNDYKDYSSKQDTSSKQNRQNCGESRREIVLRQKIYYVDSQGHLLDQNKYYLLNSKNQQIMIPDHLLNCLKENNMLTNQAPVSLSNSLVKRR